MLHLGVSPAEHFHRQKKKFGFFSFSIMVYQKLGHDGQFSVESSLNNSLYPRNFLDISKTNGDEGLEKEIYLRNTDGGGRGTDSSW